MRLKDDSACKEDLQAGRAWGALGFKLADEIDRAMCAAEGIAALQRAADLVTLLDAGEAGAVEIRVMRGEVKVMVIDSFVPGRGSVLEIEGPDAIAEAAAWCRQRGGA
jgi:hypothetical protein